MIIIKTPTRISLIGGGTDVPLFFNKHGGAVIGSTINKYSYITARTIPNHFNCHYKLVYSQIETAQQVDQIDHKYFKAALDYFNTDHIELHHISDLPGNLGLGSSSAFMVAVIHALSIFQNKRYASFSKRNLAEIAINIERNILGEAGGWQDQIWSSYGGINMINFYNKTFDVNPIPIVDDHIKRLEKHLLLIDTGISRRSSEVAKTYVDDEAKMQTNIAIKNLVQPAYDAIISENYKELGKLITESWTIKRELSNSVSNNKIDEIQDISLKKGAYGFKLLGSGGGGVALIVADPTTHQSILNNFIGLFKIDFKFEFGGSRIILYDN